MRAILIAVLLFASSVASAEHRNLLFLQQLLPGHIEYVSLVEIEEGAVVRAMGMGASTLNRTSAASATEFAELWKLANSPDLAAYKLTSEDDENMADPKYFTVSVSTGTRREFFLKIPVEGHNESASAFIDRLQRYMQE